MQNFKKRLLYSFVSLGALATAAGTASAQNSERPSSEEQAPEVKEIVVTGARLRQESVQDVPIAVSVVNAATIEAQRTTNITALSGIVPNLSIGTNTVSPGVPTISLRGFSTRNGDASTEPGVPVYIDGIYQTLITGSMSDVYDIENIEVLRGPQGTLLGKNASAGAILINRTRPKMTFGGKASIEYGSYNLVQAQGLINVPVIADVLAVKLYANYRSRDGWVKNLAVPDHDLGGEKRGTVRAALLFKPTDDFELYLSGDYLWDRSQQPGQRLFADTTQVVCGAFGFCGPDPDIRRVTSATFLAKPVSDENNIAANAKWNLGSATLTSITGYRSYKQLNNNDADSTPQPILHLIQLTKTNDFSQELRLTSNAHENLDLNGKLSWLLAAYYGHAKAPQELGLLAFGGTSTAFQISKRESYAVYGHADYLLTPEWEISVGARRSWDQTDHSYTLREPGTARPPLAAVESRSFRNTSFEAGTRYQFNADKMVYFRYAEGYRSGGFVGLPTSVATSASYSPEYSTSYELGAKTDWLDGRLRLNATLFTVKFNDLQRDIVRRNPDGTFTEVTQNAASARTRGFELESVARPVKDLTIRANFGYLDAQYLSYETLDGNGNPLDLSGRPLLLAPKYTATLDADYAFSLGGSGTQLFDSGNFQMGVNWRSSFTHSASDNPIGRQSGYAVVTGALSIGNEAKGYKLTAYVDNLFDKNFKIGGETVGGLFKFISDNIGRTAGVVFDLKF